MSARTEERFDARIDAQIDAQLGERFAKRTRRWRHSFWWHALRVLAFLTCVHALIAVSLLPIFGALTAMLYAFFPPMATIAAYDAIRDAPMFALLCLALAVGAAATLSPLARTVARALPFFPRILALLTLAIWMPALSAESLRWALMQNEIVDAQPQCHGTHTLMASLRARNGFGDFDHGFAPHAWMMKNGEIRLWSYRRLRFEPAPGWRGATNCASAARAVDPFAGQRW